MPGKVMVSELIRTGFMTTKFPEISTCKNDRVSGQAIVEGGFRYVHRLSNLFESKTLFSEFNSLSNVHRRFGLTCTVVVRVFAEFFP